MEELLVSSLAQIDALAKLRLSWLTGTDAQFCLREWGISNSHAARIVVKQLRDYPEELHRNEFVLAIWALNVAFPCKKKG